MRRKSSLQFARLVGGSALVCLACGVRLQAQEDAVAKEKAAADAAAAAAATPASAPAQPPMNPMGEAKPPEGAAAPATGDKKEGDKPAETPVMRPAEPPKPPNAAELNVRPDAEGWVSFSFKGQPWPAVLEWLADISDMSLEWQAAPPGYLDLTTRGKYKVAEVRDLINSVLLTRGYTLLENGEVLMVVNLTKLDVAMVPRVTAAELDQRGSHELVKTFFDLHRLRADAVAEELKPLLSTYGKIAALKTTNRLDVLETAGNLRRLRDLLADEQDASGQQFEVREFALRFARADDVVQTVSKLLGIKSSDSAMPMTPEQMQQQQAMMQQMQQMQQQGGAPAMPQAPSEIYLAVNRRENSVLAHASADKLAMIEQAISYLDVPPRRGQGGAFSADLPRIQVYRLAGIDPDPVVKVLRDLGSLDPTTTLEVDKANKAIIVNAPLVDHVMVRSVIEKLDGSGRHFEVIQLRRLSAEYVAGSIEFLFRGAEKKDDDQRRRRYYYYDFYGSNNEEEQEKDSFQVEPDIRNNRLLLRANDVELEEVRELLVKLGEIDPEGVVRDTTRTIRLPAGKETEELLRRLERMWPSVSPNPLHVEPNDASEEEEAPAKGGEAPAVEPATNDVTASAERNIVTVALAEEAAPTEADDNTAGEPTETARRETAMAPSNRGLEPVNITRGPNGLIVSSQDPEALDRLMSLMDELSPPEMGYRVFELHNTYAKDVAKLLKDVFEVKKQDSDNDPFMRWYYFDEYPQSENTSRSRLSQKRPLKFVPDAVTNTVLVQGADEQQMMEIESLIEMYDRAEPLDSQSVRKTEILQVKYASAPEVATVVKDVYRDLLSPNDPALQTGQPPQEQQRPSFFSLLRDDTKDNLPRFKGLLSVGVNPKTNSIVVCAPQFLLTEVKTMIKTLDDAALPDRPVAQVKRVGGIVNDPLLRAILTNVANPNATTPATVQQPSQQNNQNGDREGRRRGGRRDRNENRENQDE